MIARSMRCAQLETTSARTRRLINRPTDGQGHTCVHGGRDGCVGRWGAIYGVLIMRQRGVGSAMLRLVSMIVFCLSVSVCVCLCLSEFVCVCVYLSVYIQLRQRSLSASWASVNHPAKWSSDIYIVCSCESLSRCLSRPCLSLYLSASEWSALHFFLFLWLSVCCRFCLTVCLPSVLFGRFLNLPLPLSLSLLVRVVTTHCISMPFATFTVSANLFQSQRASLYLSLSVFLSLRLSACISTSICCAWVSREMGLNSVFELCLDLRDVSMMNCS